MKKQDGFTLVEFLVVMILLGIFATWGANELGKLKYVNSVRCVNTINSQIDALRTEALSKKDPYYLIIYQDDTNQDYYLIITSDASDLNTGRIRIADSDMKISYTLGSNTYVVGEETGERNQIVIQYKKGIGSFVDDYKSIEISNQSGSRSSTIILIKDTGKHYVQ